LQHRPRDLSSARTTGCEVRVNSERRPDTTRSSAGRPRLAADDVRAEQHAEIVLAEGTMPDGTERSPTRMTEARLTLAAVAGRRGDLEPAVGLGVSALNSDRRSLPSLPMVAGELDHELRRRYPSEPAAAEYHEALRDSDKPSRRR
jgi:hypothetical protein